MTRPWRILYAGAKYHLSVRGNAKDTVFLVHADYERFLEQLQDALEQDKVVLYAYVLMPNHYHLLVETPRGNVQKFMQRLNTAYGMYFRFKHNRSGHCFQGRYGAKLVEGNEYLVRLTRYIHLNPVKTQRFKDAGHREKKAFLEGYHWSSYRGYAGLGEKSDWVNYRWLKLMGRMTDKGNQTAYRKYIDQMLGAEDEVLAQGRKYSIYSIGDEKFAEQTKSDMDAARFSKVDTGDIAWPVKERKPLKEAMPVVLKMVGLTTEEFKDHGLAIGDKKMMAIELLCRFSSASQRALMPYCGYKHESAVGKQRKSLRLRLKEDTSLAKKFRTLQNKAAKDLDF